MCGVSIGIAVSPTFSSPALSWRHFLSFFDKTDSIVDKEFDETFVSEIESSSGFHLFLFAESQIVFSAIRPLELAASAYAGHLGARRVGVFPN